MEYKSKRIKTCEICREEANIICFNCTNYYCDSCSKFIHEKKINQNHIKDKINIFQLLNIICETHQKKLEYFCIEENSKKI